MAEVAVAYVTLLPSARGFRQNTVRTLTPHVSGAGAVLGGTFSRSFGRTFTTGITSNTTGVQSALREFSRSASADLSRVTLAAQALVGVSGAIGLKMAANLQSAQIGFETLLHSASKASKFLTNVRNFAVRTPFSIEQTIFQARALLGVGFAARDIIPILTQLGNVTSAFGLGQEQFNGIMRAFTQIASKGKVQAEELLQIAENGLPAVQLLSKALGISVTQLQAMTAAGELSANEALPALLKQLKKDYAGSMARQFNTLTGVFNNFKESARLALSDAVQPLVPILQRALPQATAAVKSALDGVSGSMRELINGFAGTTGTLPLTFFERLGGVAAQAFAGFKAGLTGLRSLIQANAPTLESLGATLRDRILPDVKDLAGALGPALRVAAQQFFDVLGTVGVPALRHLAGALERVGPALKTTVDFLANNASFITPFAVAVGSYLVTVKAVAKATQAWAAAQAAVNAAMAANPFVLAAAAVIGLAAGMVYLNETEGAAHDTFIKFGRVATAITQVIGTNLQRVLSAALQAIQGLLKGLDAVTTIGGLIDDNSPFKRMAGQIEDAQKQLDRLQDGLNGLPQRIDIAVGLTFVADTSAIPTGTSLRQLADGIASNTQGHPTSGADSAAAKRIRDQINAISKAVLPDAKKGGGEIGKLLGQSVADGIASKKKAAADKAAEAVKEAVDKAKQALADAKAELRNFSHDIRDQIQDFGNLTSISSQTGAAATPNSLRRFLDNQLRAIKKFQANLKALVKRGLPSSILSKIAEAGPDQGGPIAEALVRANRDQFGDIVTAQQAIDKRARNTGRFVAGQVLGPKVAEARTVVEHLEVNVYNAKEERASTSVPKAVRRALIRAGA